MGVIAVRSSFCGQDPLPAGSSAQDCLRDVHPGAHDRACELALRDPGRADGHVRLGRGAARGAGRDQLQAGPLHLRGCGAPGLRVRAAVSSRGGPDTDEIGIVAHLDPDAVLASLHLRARIVLLLTLMVIRTHSATDNFQ